MSWSHQTESAIVVGELVSHNDLHVGPSLSNLYDGIGDGHNLHSDIHVWTSEVYHQKLVGCPHGEVG